MDADMKTLLCVLLLTQLPSLGHSRTTRHTTINWRYTTHRTTPKPIFFNNHDRDSFIMQISASVAEIKNTLTNLLSNLPYSGTLSHPPYGATQSVSTQKPGTETVSGYNSFVAFMARLSHQISHLGNRQIVRFDDVVVNRGNGYDAKLGVFRCPVAGTYQFSVAMGSYGGVQLGIYENGREVGKAFSSRSLHGADGSRIIQALTKNRVKRAGSTTRHWYDTTTPYWYATTTPGPTHHTTPKPYPSSTQVLVDLRVGDEVWVEHISDNHNDVLYGNGMTSFSGHLLSPAQQILG